MDNAVLKKLQSLELDILREIDRICTENKIAYVLGYGTLLGAVRHAGFIPWDDDIDLFMPRADYERFVEICKTELADKFLLHYQGSDENYPLSMTKIRLKGTAFIEKEVDTKLSSQGIWVDIFPLDNAKKSYSRLQNMQFMMVSAIGTIRGGRLGWFDKSKWSKATKTLYFLLRWMSTNALYNLQIAVSKLNHNEKSEYCVEFAGAYGAKRQTFRKDDLFPPRKITFVDGEFCVPKNAEKILEHIYGADYMTPPPKEKQVTHSPIRIDFGPYAD